MSPLRILRLITLVVIMGSCGVGAGGGKHGGKKKKSDRAERNKKLKYRTDNPCRLWLAPSHLSQLLSMDEFNDDPNPKFTLGIFAGVEFKENEAIPPGPELGIPIIDWMEMINRNNRMHNRTLEFLESQVWTADYDGRAKWAGNYSALLAVPGIGNLANYHSGIYNIDWYQPSALLRSRNNEITKPGEPHITRGAISEYYNMTMVATTNISAGMELFANFGDTWDNITDRDLYQDKLTRYDYYNADMVLDHILGFFQTYKEDHMQDMQLQEEVLDFMLDTVLGSAAGKHAKVIKSLIPANPNKLQQVKDAGGTFNYRNRDLVKSQTWLHEYGICMDNLRVGTSTNPKAGRGAFATRNIAKGSVVVPSPMLHVTDAKRLFQMYEIEEIYDETKSNNEDEDEDEEPKLIYNKKKPLGQQLITNYCFGHPESSLYLFPVGSMINYINHAPSHGEKGTKIKANAYITWSEFNDHTLHDMTIKELNRCDSVSIVMNIVATKDIKEGEEIFLDYGPEWTRAYNKYEDEYKKKYEGHSHKRNGTNWPIRAEDMIEQYKNIPFPVNLKKHKNPYPPGVATACYLQTKEIDDGLPRVDWEYNKDEEENVGVDILQFIGPATIDDYRGIDLCICDLVDRVEDQTNRFNYTVMAKLPDGTIEKVVRVPHRAVTFIDKPYQSDMHAQNSFRHYIGIRDNDFPQAWRDIRK